MRPSRADLGRHRRTATDTGPSRTHLRVGRHGAACAPGSAPYFRYGERRKACRDRYNTAPGHPTPPAGGALQQPSPAHPAPPRPPRLQGAPHHCPPTPPAGAPSTAPGHGTAFGTELYLRPQGR